MLEEVKNNEVVIEATSLIAEAEAQAEAEAILAEASISEGEDVKVDAPENTEEPNEASKKDEGQKVEPKSNGQTDDG